jgi:hypothetical protein
VRGNVADQLVKVVRLVGPSAGEENGRREATDVVVRDEAQVDPREIVQIDGRVRLPRPGHARPEVHMV